MKATRYIWESENKITSIDFAVREDGVWRMLAIKNEIVIEADGDSNTMDGSKVRPDEVIDVRLTFEEMKSLRFKHNACQIDWHQNR